MSSGGTEPTDRQIGRAQKTMATDMKDMILASLSAVAAERKRRQDAPELARQVEAVKAYQQRRFQHTYDDLLQSSRYQQAAQFFLDELYGPGDFARRDQQFSRIVPKLVSLFPAEVVATVHDLAQLHETSEQLDTQMAVQLGTLRLGPASYAHAWQQLGEPSRRQFQLDTVLRIGRAIDRFTRHAWLMTALRMMRRPAQAAGLAELQVFLEQGMACFRTMKGADEFLSIVEQRESQLMQNLFSASEASKQWVLTVLPE